MPAGPLAVTLFDCTILSVETGTLRRVPVVSVYGTLELDRRNGTVGYLNVPAFAFLRVMVIGQDGLPDKSGLGIGVATTHGTIEGVAGPDGYSDFWIPIGLATGYLLGRKATKVDLVVDPQRGDGAVMRLRLPASGDPGGWRG
jgi:hypothetical protein